MSEIEVIVPLRGLRMEATKLELATRIVYPSGVAFATARDCTLVAASGNSGDQQVYWPAAFPEVIAVGSVGLDGAARFCGRTPCIPLYTPAHHLLNVTLRAPDC